jgi:hypothetical protein
MGGEHLSPNGEPNPLAGFRIDEIDQMYGGAGPCAYELRNQLPDHVHVRANQSSDENRSGYSRPVERSVVVTKWTP